jgi:cyclic dehypoxanthinyl futalosine synthase
MIPKIIEKVIDNQMLSLKEGLTLYTSLPTSELMAIAHHLRMKLNPNLIVGWIIDRNINLTNVCISQCKFCNFCRPLNHTESYILTIDEYHLKIEELFALGGKQLLLQGGMHPKLGLSYYEELFKLLKTAYPSLKLHALGPPEIVYLAKKEKCSYKEVLVRLQESGLDSLPGAGAEILSDRVRQLISPAKASTNEWLEVMKIAHQLNLPTSATMMFGHLETKEERIEHLIKIRDLQKQKPTNSYGFSVFVPWPFQSFNTKLQKEFNQNFNVSTDEYVRTIAISRIMLPNIQHIQASWLTVGKQTGQLCLYAGADDLGSIMIEENVVSSAGSHHQINLTEMQKLISDAGFIPQQRNQLFEKV